MRHLGLVGLGRPQAASIVGLEATGFQPQPGRGTDASGGVEKHFGTDAPTVAEGRDGPTLRVDLDRFDLDAEPQLHAALAQFVHELLDDLAIDELEELLAQVDQGDRHVHRRKDGGIFEPDDAGADDGEAFGHPRIARHVVAIEHVGVVEGNVLGPIRRRAHRDDDAARLERVLAVVAVLDRDVVRIEEAGAAGDGLDAVASELVLQDVDFVVEASSADARPDPCPRCLS